MTPEMLAMTLVDVTQMDVSLPENGTVRIYGGGASPSGTTKWYPGLWGSARRCSRTGP